MLGLDPHAPSIDEARATGGEGIEYAHGDLFDVQAAPAEVVTAVAMLHHVDMADGLRRLASLVAPGGTLLVVGLARSTYPADLPYDAVGAVAVRLHRQWHTSAPIVWPPPVSYRDARRIAGGVLPGVRFRRDPRFRYTLAWRQTEA